MVASDTDVAAELLTAARGIAAAHRLPQVTLRCQGTEDTLYARLVNAGWRVHWTDLRMTLEGYAGKECEGVGLSNWEI